ncbi:alkaline phosphatase D family protein [Aureibacter tunicatorum]|uniref:Alkaline phosphatase D n=1 Tax=Aureibacter tunicatorum TaxID=866807 RepID=A0AAE4BS47_9BACT|nr:alkaline phosphatase D family protein [Aureibacter tunicatorum]MDR6239381.1 alkaline phosphatase D [Aureibacter tunicatorum]BDD04696.1 alkaline phosphatase [Aureibacter tunicatorum]
MQRRKFLNKALLASGGMILPLNLVSCKSDEENQQSPRIEVESFQQKNFEHGVASFDPTLDGVIIWTRYNGESGSELIAEIASDAGFENIIRTKKAIVDSANDNTLSIEVRDLDSGLKLYYRFSCVKDQAVSRVGNTLTFAQDISSIKMAVCSCSNYPAGYFNVYKEIAESDADLVVHLGDYIYEHGAGGYGSGDFTKVSGRDVKPSTEIISLDDYRTRYKQYRGDEDLMLAHQNKPFICVWDDHEITDNTYKNGAVNHNEGEGDFNERKMNAIKAYSEYLPKLNVDQGSERIYRHLEIGGLVDLLMLDTRVYGRDKQLDYADYFTDTGLDVAKFMADLTDQNRTILGVEQRQWLIEKSTTSQATWQVLGQQVLMGKMVLPVELLLLTNQVASGNSDEEAFIRLQTLIGELVAIKMRIEANDPTLTDHEKARVTNALPYNLDAWDGYPVEREMVLKAFQGKRLIVLAGDTHNAWNNDLTDGEGNLIGQELATASVTSPGLEKYLNLDSQSAPAFEQAFQVLISDLKYLNAKDRGYLAVVFDNNSANVEWIYIDAIESKSYNASKGHSVVV